MNPLTIDVQKAWLTLLHAPGLGPVKGAALLREFGDPQVLLAASPGQRRAIVKLPADTESALSQPNLKAIAADLAWLDAPHRYLIPLSDSRYPAALAEIYDPPLVLFAEGRIELLQQPQLAIVGSRNPDHYGQNLARDFAAALAAAGITITSGLALGIDAAAHRGALDAAGDTIAVVGTGLDRVYPAAHAELAALIRKHGCIVSELAVGTAPKAHLFPRRNRIISALSLGTLVVQAALRSGSLITARLANEQGREVFALPGSIHNPLSKGCHSLLRQGAKLVETCEDILLELNPALAEYLQERERFTRSANSEIMTPKLGEIRTEPGLTASNLTGLTGGNLTGLTGTDLTDPQHSVLRLLTAEPCSIDSLVERSQLSSAVITSMLQELEIRGHVSSRAGRYYRIQS